MKRLFATCYYINVFMLIVVLFTTVATVINPTFFMEITGSELYISLRHLFSIPMVVLWVWCLVLWSKYDKKISRFFLLFFLMGFYPVLYYHRVKKNNWIKE